jgi:hypothetical protein
MAFINDNWNAAVRSIMRVVEEQSQPTFDEDFNFVRYAPPLQYPHTPIPIPMSNRTNQARTPTHLLVQLLQLDRHSWLAQPPSSKRRQRRAARVHRVGGNLASTVRRHRLIPYVLPLSITLYISPSMLRAAPLSTQLANNTRSENMNPYVTD